MRRLPHWLAMLPVSLMLHGSLVAAAVAFLRMEPAPPPLVLDLEAIIAGGSEGSGGEAPRPRSLASQRPARAAETREPATPSVPPSAAAPLSVPAPIAPPTVPPPSVAAPAPAPSSASDGPTRGGDADVVRASGPANGGGAAASSGTGSASSGSGSSTSDGPRGGVGSGVVAALPPGTGSGGGSGVGAAIGAEYGPYLEGIRQRIQETLRYPASAVRRGVKGTVQLEIAIETDGRISSVSVVTSSAHDTLDRAALETVRSLPRVPFPRDLRPQPLRVRVPVVFDLR